MTARPCTGQPACEFPGRHPISGSEHTPKSRPSADWHREAERCVNRGDWPGAVAACRALLEKDPAHADAHFLLGMATLAQGAPAKALQLIDRALALAPGTAEYEVQAARCLALTHRDAEALARVDKVLAAGVDDAGILDTLGVVCARAGDHARAAALFRRALDRRPDDAGIAFNLGASLRFLGRFDDAETAFEQVLRLDPGAWRVHPAIASLRRQTDASNHVERLERALAEGAADADGELQIRHALAKELEDLGRDAEAFRHLEAGKARKRATLEYDFATDEALFDAVRAAFPPGLPPQSAPGYPTSEPIFVVGMPRSGTTLVERILSSHPAVTGAGELQNFGIVLKRLAGTRSPRVLDPETIAAGLGVEPAVLGRAYLDSTRPQTGSTPRFVDKMPLNFFYLGFIRRALPDARIVCLRRGLLDTCLGNFRQLFAVGFSYYNYAFDLGTTARYCVEFDRLIRQWRDVLGDALLEVRYETLVANPEPEIRRLLAHCGLGFEPGCLEFERNPAPVATASAVQVREPLNARSIGRWRRFRAELAPAIEIFETAGLPLE